MIKQKLVPFLKSESVLLICALLAAASAFFVKPDREYLAYIDFRTLALLFCLMAVMAGFRGMGLFSLLAQKLLKRVSDTRSLTLTLCLVCFFSAMLITNDVALITFVPFTIVAFKKAGKRDRLIFTVCLETVAANLGSMLTPVGNPQNLYIFSFYSMNAGQFLSAVAPNGIFSLVLVCLCALFVKKEPIRNVTEEEFLRFKPLPVAVCSLIFVLSLLSVFRVLDYRLLFAVSVVLFLLFERKTLLKIDYSLLFTFVFLFIFIGNLGRIEPISDFLKSIVGGREVAVSVALSQIFSNVPCAVLLSGFTENASALLTGVNLGGLGTLIASMASLISFKLIQKERLGTGKTVAVFSVMNLAFLCLNLALYFTVCRL